MNGNPELLELWNKVGNIPASEVWVEAIGNPSAESGVYHFKDGSGQVETEMISLVIRPSDDPERLVKQPVSLEVTKTADPTQRMIDYFKWYVENVAK